MNYPAVFIIWKENYLFHIKYKYKSLTTIVLFYNDYAVQNKFNIGKDIFIIIQ